MNAGEPLPVREALKGRAFADEFVARQQPVLVKGVLQNCPALSRWNLAWLGTVSGAKMVSLKEWAGGTIATRLRSLGSYVDDIQQYERRLSAGLVGPAERPAYLHDVPLASILDAPSADLDPALQDYFPSWYGAEWHRFAQFFLGPSHSLTPLHFDCLLTHNLFFQVSGRKRFVLLPYAQRHFCYRTQWRWFEVDVERPDFERFPLYRQATPAEVIVEPGDMLYLPPGTLHHVRSLDAGISFNVDWHTPRSALHGVFAFRHGMPSRNVYYNAVIALGLWSGLPVSKLMPYYRSYLNYVS